MEDFEKSQDKEGEEGSNRIKCDKGDVFGLGLMILNHFQEEEEQAEEFEEEEDEDEEGVEEEEQREDEEEEEEERMMKELAKDLMKEEVSERIGCEEARRRMEMIMYWDEEEERDYLERGADQGEQQFEDWKREKQRQIVERSVEEKYDMDLKLRSEWIQRMYNKEVMNERREMRHLFLRHNSNSLLEEPLVVTSGDSSSSSSSSTKTRRETERKGKRKVVDNDDLVAGWFRV